MIAMRLVLVVICLMISSPSVWAREAGYPIESAVSADNKVAPGKAADPDQPRPLKKDGSDISDNVMIDVLQLKDLGIAEVFKLISDKTGLNIIAGQGISGQVTIYLKNVRLKDVMRIILDANNLAYTVKDGVVHIITAQEYERRFGRVFGGDITTKIRRLRYMDVNDTFTLLNQVKSSSGKIIADGRSNTLVLMDAPSQIKLMEELIDQVDKPMTVRVFDLNYAKAKDVAEKLDASLLSKNGTVKFDEASNKLIVTDSAEKIEQIAKVIEAFDVKRPQVLIEAKIVQIILSDQQKLGVDWEAVVDKFHNLDIKNNFDILDSGARAGSLSIGTLAGDNYEVLVQALDSQGTTDILSSPRIMTIDGQEAKILVGSSEPYVTSSTTTPSSGPTTIAESINFIEVGIKLYVTPQIHKDKFITMKIKPEVSSVTRTLKTANNNTIPIVDTSEAETTVTVKDGVTIVIGGLIKDEDIVSKNKVPILGNIPVVGLAFRNSDDLKRKTEIVVFLTPRIMTGDVPAETTGPASPKQAGVVSEHSK